MKNYRPACPDLFPADLADTIVEMAQVRTGLSGGRSGSLIEEGRRRFDDAT